MADDLRLSEENILDWIGDDRALQRGRRYFAEGRVSAAYRNGDTLTALVRGTAPEPYEVEVLLGEGGVEEAECSCPIGDGGGCKHVAAVLLAWAADSSAFRAGGGIESFLELYSQAELVALVKRMLDRHSDLRRLLERYPPSSVAAGSRIAPDAVVEQIEAAYAGAEYGRQGSRRLVKELMELVSLADGYAAQGDTPAAVAVYSAICRTVPAHLGEAGDDGDDLEAVYGAVEGLDRALDQTSIAAQRRAILDSLFKVVCWDIEFGGQGIGDEAQEALLDKTTPAERELLAQWVRAALPAPDRGPLGMNYKRQRFGELLLGLSEESDHDEGYIRICRETGRIPDLVERLLSLHRVVEAGDAARQENDYGLLTLLPIFAAHGQGALAEKLVRARLGPEIDRRLVNWLIEQAENRGDVLEALKLALRLYNAAPSWEGYRRVRLYAQGSDDWPKLHSALLAELAEQKRHDLLAEIHLHEKNIPAALVALEQVKVWPGSGTALHRRVAEAAEAARPRDAIRIYLTLAKNTIDLRGRDNYVEAVELLKRVRKLYRGLNDEVGWQEVIAGLREQHHTLRALQEELNRAGL